MNIASIGAHQDDEMFCLGTLLKYRKRGDRIALICATNAPTDAQEKSPASLASGETARWEWQVVTED